MVTVNPLNPEGIFYDFMRFQVAYWKVMAYNSTKKIKGIIIKYLVSFDRKPFQKFGRKYILNMFGGVTTAEKTPENLIFFIIIHIHAWHDDY